MNEREAFIRAIGENLYDDTPRLAFADWLDERGEHDRAEFIRVQCELEPMRDKYEIPRAAELHKREDELYWKNRQTWIATLPMHDDDVGSSDYDFRRGFPEVVRLPVRFFLNRGSEIRVACPLIRRLVLFRLDGGGELLAACKHLEGLPELELACWYSDNDARAVAASPHLATLQKLELWLGRRWEVGTDEELCRILGGSNAWPQLRELVLLDPDGEQGNADRLIPIVNAAAGRQLGRYQIGYPELFPLAPGYRGGFPGRLPDGRTALANLDHTSPDQTPVFHIIIFDADADQTDEVITVPLSAELLAIPTDSWYLSPFDDLCCRYLLDTVGLTPAFIRVRAYEFPSQPHDGPVRGREDHWSCLGYPDHVDSPRWMVDRGELIYGLVRNGEFVAGEGCWWCDKRGLVHST